MPEKHGKSFIGFVGLVVFCTSFINTYFIANEITHHKQASNTVSALPAILGEQTENPPENIVSSELLVRFKKDPRIFYDQGLSITIPFINRKVILRQEGLKSHTYGAALNPLIKAQQVTNSRMVFNYRDASSLQVFQYTLNDKNRLVALKNELKNNPSVVSVSYNYLVQTSVTPNDPDYQQNGKYLQWNMEQIGMPSAWSILNSAPAQTVGVAVVDTGIAYENYTDQNPANCYSGNSKQPCINAGAQYVSHNDWPSDVFLPGIDLINNDQHPNDDESHGTHVAGTIAQAANNSLRFAGMTNFNSNLRVKLMPVKTMDAKGAGTTAEILTALEHIRTYNQNAAVKIRVVNLSVGFDAGGDDPVPELHQAIIDMVDSQVLLVAAAGNGGADGTGHARLSFPARYTEVLSVGAVKYDQKRAQYSNYETGRLDVVAPGGQILNDTSTEYLDENGDNYPDGIFQSTIVPPEGSNKFTTDFTHINEPEAAPGYCKTSSNSVIKPTCGLFQGTSMASPHVTALAALIFSVNPNLSPSEVEAIIKSSADKTMSGYNESEYGAGLIDAAASLTAVLNGLPSLTPTPTATGTPDQCQELVRNGGFEDGLPTDTWTRETSSSELIFNNNNKAPYSGEWYAWMLGYHNGSDKLCQTIDLPDGTTNTLSFYYAIATYDTNIDPVDKIEVVIKQGENNHTVYSLSQLDKNSQPQHLAQYEQVFVGLTENGPAKLCFEATSDNRLITNIYLDEIKIQSCNGNLTPTPTSTPTPPTATPTNQPSKVEKIVFDNLTEIFLINPDGTGNTQLTNDGITKRNAVISPDGTMISYAARNSNNLYDLWIMNISGENKTKLLSLDYQYLFLSFSPDSTKISYTGWLGSDGLYIVNSDGTNNHQITSMDAWRPYWAEDGKIYFNGNTFPEDSHRKIYYINPDGTGLGKVESDIVYSVYETISCGDYIFASIMEGVNLETDIYRLNKDGTNRIKIVDRATDSTLSDCSPNNNNITYEWNGRIYTTDINGNQTVDVTAGNQPNWGKIGGNGPAITPTATPTSTPPPNTTLTPTPTLSPNTTPSPTLTGSPPMTPIPATPTPIPCGTGATVDGGDLNHDCYINSLDWSLMWKHWTAL